MSDNEYLSLQKQKRLGSFPVLLISLHMENSHPLSTYPVHSNSSEKQKQKWLSNPKKNKQHQTLFHTFGPGDTMNLFKSLVI